MKTYIFDLDETLYAPNEESARRRVDHYVNVVQEKLNITSYEQAKNKVKDLYLQYGTTYAGLAELTDISYDEFHSFSKKWDYTEFHDEDKELESLIKQLDGKKFLYSAGHRDHVERVLKAMAIDINIFDGVFANEDGNTLMPKPQKVTQDIFIEKFNIDKSSVVYLDDSVSCIKSAVEDGWNECLLVNHGENFDVPYKQINNVKDYLKQII